MRLPIPDILAAQQQVCSPATKGNTLVKQFTLCQLCFVVAVLGCLSICLIHGVYSPEMFSLNLYYLIT